MQKLILAMVADLTVFDKCCMRVEVQVLRDVRVRVTGQFMLWSAPLSADVVCGRNGGGRGLAYFHGLTAAFIRRRP